MALQNASRAKERRLEDLTRRALAGGQAEGSSSSSEEDEDAALAAKYLGNGAGAGVRKTLEKLQQLFMILQEHRPPGHPCQKTIRK